MSRSKTIVVLGVAVAAALLVTSVFADNRGVSFTSIGFLPGVPGTPISTLWEMNADGTEFIASPVSSTSVQFLWTPENGWGDQIGTVTGTIRMSATGDTIASNGIFPGSSPAFLWPGTWTGTTNVWDPIPSNPGYAPCGSSRLSMNGMSGEGDHITGLTWQGCAIAHAFAWDKATNTSVDLGTPNARSTRGNAITADGTKVVGFGTMLQGLRRGTTFENGAATFIGDPNALEPKSCKVTTTKACTSNTSGQFGCPEFVDDASCPNSSKGTCVSGACVGGFDAGKPCTNTGQCGGICLGGPSAGARCTSNGNCPDTLVCINNPAWTTDLYKGEAYDMTPDGAHAVGRSYNDTTKFNSGWHSNPDGTFDEMPPPPTWPNLVDAFRISRDGTTAVGVAGTQLTGKVPIVWRKGVGTIDLQLFLVAQGLDELFFWGLVQANAVSSDGHTIAGYGVNPDGRIEGWIVDMSKLWICHTPPGQPENARTLGITIESAADHVAHGDFLGTCEFQDSGALSRAADMRSQLLAKYASIIPNVDDQQPNLKKFNKLSKENVKKKLLGAIEE